MIPTKFVRLNAGVFGERMEEKRCPAKQSRVDRPPCWRIVSALVGDMASFFLFCFE